MRLGTRAIAALAFAMVACSPSPALDPGDLQGYWVLESFEVDGVEHPVEVLVNTARTPWIMIGGGLEGSGGCNDFTGFGSPPYRVEGSRLFFGDIMFTAALCHFDGSESVMAAELAMLDALWQSPDGVVVQVDASEMVWDTGDTRLVFSKVDAPPDA